MGVGTDEVQVRAAGGVVRRDESGVVRILLVHRPRYDDWSLPKGKLDPGESFEDAAVREVQEETGVAARLAHELEPVTYRDGKGRSKLVRYWVMDVDDEGRFEPNEEVDEIRWMTPAEAGERLSYLHDAELVRRAAL